MALLRTIKDILFKRRPPLPETAPAEGYNLWAPAYDAQPDNLMLALDEALFAQLRDGWEVAGKTIVDVGCGTGRHWAKLLAQGPSELVGYDVSEGMLAMLQQKMPSATVHLLDATGALTHTADASVDLVISTLTIAHIPDAAAAIAEWCRVLQPGGHLLITDYHPTALARGANRSFSHQGKTVHLKNHVHPIEAIKAALGQRGVSVLRLVERTIDDSMQHWYEKQSALAVFEQYKGTPIIYGLLAKK
jgi:ubiquinone/menaquinone biosynthesis C-methylase UbiE